MISWAAGPHCLYLLNCAYAHNSNILRLISRGSGFGTFSLDLRLKVKISPVEKSTAMLWLAPVVKL